MYDAVNVLEKQLLSWIYLGIQAYGDKAASYNENSLVFHIHIAEFCAQVVPL
jgi:hypothetical protein